MTRGERNRNPGNLDRHDGVHWVGQSADQSTDPRFVVFDTAVFGIRALAKTLLTYYRKYGLKTVTGIIKRWAPGVENNTQAYIDAVAEDMGVQPSDNLKVDDPDTLQALTEAIIHHENGGCTYDDATLADGIKRALA